MSQRKAQIVHGLFEGVKAVQEGRDPGSAFDMVAREFELVPAQEVPGTTRYRGLDGFAEFMRTWTEDFEAWSIELERVIDVGDDRVVAMMHQQGSGKRSGVRVDVRFGGVHEFEDGRLVRTQLYMSPADALEAVGLTADAGVAGLSFSEGAEAYAERGLDGLAESWHEDVVYEEDPLFPGAATYRGREAVLARFHEYEEQLGASEVAIDEIAERPGGAVIVWRHWGVTPGSGVPFEQRWGWTVQERDGKAIHIRAYVDPDEALSSADR